MEQLKIGSWTIEVDVANTKAFYDRQPPITQNWNSVFEQNYVLACDTFPQEVKDLFHSLGVDPHKQGEVNEYKENEDGSHIYGGFYFIVGKIISGPDFWINTEDDSMPNFETVSGIQIAFTDELAMTPDEEDLQPPVIQLEFQLNIPWLLN
ncbi:hypothetical protein [Bacillus sp. 1NLA3E]|uniref:hypothetical protein n=1 Tax=Bacillus sp. 1NLA3E TaxID=666686 RepID=UPI000247EEB8|nr:hypothetical protein [Bacillus sp. 1NLA3E]AGK53674.1 hypothetical protein B1NLA3E_09580 [Bacillus sp. 1NLA3E]